MHKPPMPGTVAAALLEAGGRLERSRRQLDAIELQLTMLLAAIQAGLRLVRSE